MNPPNNIQPNNQPWVFPTQGFANSNAELLSSSHFNSGLLNGQNNINSFPAYNPYQPFGFMTQNSAGNILNMPYSYNMWGIPQYLTNMWNMPMVSPAGTSNLLQSSVTPMYGWSMPQTAQSSVVHAASANGLSTLQNGTNALNIPQADEQLWKQNNIAVDNMYHNQRQAYNNDLLNDFLAKSNSQSSFSSSPQPLLNVTCQNQVPHIIATPHNTNADSSN